ncbi:putative Zinc finger, CHY-type superfamily [Plasmopara halstedii]
MCKHITNAQVSFQAPCCKRWFDCSECHFEMSSHRQQWAAEMAFLCKQCSKPFRKDMVTFDEEDESCPHCTIGFIQPVISVNNL